MNNRTRWDTVLVTGGAGFIGSHLVHSLLADGHRVRVFDDLSTGSHANLPPHDRVELIPGDVRDRGAIARAAAGCDMAFHLAGVVGTQLAYRRAKESYEIADRGTANLLHAIDGRPCVLFSSSSVYGLQRTDLCRESDQVSLRDGLAFDGGRRGYASGKLSLERQGEAAAARGQPVLIVRPFNVVGRAQSAAYGMVLPRFIEQALAGADLTVYGSGRQSRCFSDVTVFVRTLLGLIDRHRFARSAPLILNLGCNIPTTILELARAVLRAVSGPSTIRHITYGEVFPGRSDVHVRVPCTRSLEALVGNVRWPDIDTIVGDIVNAREGVPPSPRVLAAGQM